MFGFVDIRSDVFDNPNDKNTSNRVQDLSARIPSDEAATRYGNIYTTWP